MNDQTLDERADALQRWMEQEARDRGYIEQTGPNTVRLTVRGLMMAQGLAILLEPRALVAVLHTAVQLSHGVPPPRDDA